MKPVSPVVKELVQHEVIYAKDQPEYNPLPVLPVDGRYVVSRWELSFWERLLVLFRGSVYLSVANGHAPLQPVLLTVKFSAKEAA